MIINKYLIISLFIITISSSCKKNIEYYNNGNIKKECYKFKGNIEKLCKDYDDGGKLIIESFYFGSTNEKIIKTFSDSNNIISPYKNLLVHGNTYKTTKKGGIIEEYFFINGSEKLYKKQYYSSDLCKFEVYTVDNMKAHMLGEVYYDSLLNFKPEYSNYYNISLNERIITIKDTLKVNFEFYSGLKDIRIIFGEIDTSFNVLTKTNSDTIRVIGKEYQHKIIPNLYGINILQGVIVGTHMFNADSVKLRRMPIYINYYVVSNQEAKDSLKFFFK